MKTCSRFSCNWTSKKPGTLQGQFEPFPGRPANVAVSVSDAAYDGFMDGPYPPWLTRR